MSFLEIKAVSKAYQKGNEVVHDFSLSLEKGKVLSLVGESGSGKSTLLRIVAGLENKDSGKVVIGDLEVQNPNERLVPGYDDVQLVYQEYQLYPNSTVEENIARPLIQYDKAYRKERVAHLLKMLRLEPFKDTLPRNLSGGQQQKVAIGRALSLEPEVLLLDEPFSSLDGIQRRELIGELKEIFESLRVTVLFVTHDLDDALQMTNDLAIMQGGKLIQRGAPEDVFSKPNNMYAAKLFSHLNELPGKDKTFVRPSDLEIYKSKGLSAKVVDKQYLIHFDQLTLQLKDGTIWKAEDKKRSFKIGDRVYLKWLEKNEISF
ncbi:ABC transporter ATP-binding protein [Belliella kenyensis]|uniref:ABC transporter ATP-binding protein n=1 Tax=Belliella kenyensis TaxID=1472724 RepID=A0ABV8EHM2_9BACT|nr:ABC transporter ATP-binding protein [Belliella kenyensis]MCH7403109.1 ABC transporter ATP-binding protein [Belliella kenyensis]MDN3602278.1 ABC transporter ATP-binding protein [Belliella kenyensis]